MGAIYPYIQYHWFGHQEQNFVVFCAYFGEVNLDDFGQKEQNASQEAHQEGWAFQKCINHFCKVNSLPANVTQWTPS